MLQAVLAGMIALSGRYDQILSYVVSIDFIFFGLTGAALYRRARPDHPFGLGILATGVPVYFLWTAKKR